MGRTSVFYDRRVLRLSYFFVLFHNIFVRIEPVWQSLFNYLIAGDLSDGIMGCGMV